MTLGSVLRHSARMNTIKNCHVLFQLNCYVSYRWSDNYYDYNYYHLKFKNLLILITKQKTQAQNYKDV